MRYIKLFENKIPEYRIGSDMIVLDKGYAFEFSGKFRNILFIFNKKDASIFISFIEGENEKIEIGTFQIRKTNNGIKISNNSRYNNPTEPDFYFINKKYIPDLINFLKDPELFQNINKYNL